ncbi:unnamed protein product, partial [Rotaria sp. Silwood2]
MFRNAGLYKKSYGPDTACNKSKCQFP